MNLLRVNLMGLMAVVAVFALEFAAMRSGSQLGFSAVYSATAALLLFAVVAGKYRRGAARAFWFGFAVFGWGYLLLSLRPWSGTYFDEDQDIPRANADLITDRLVTSSLHLIRGNPPDSGAGAVGASGIDALGEFTESSAGVAHLMLTLVLALVGGFIAVALRGSRTPAKASPRRPMSPRARVLSLMAALVVSLLVGSAVYVFNRPQPVYFPDRAFDADQKPNAFVVNWYSRHLRAMGEPSLWTLSQKDHSATVYRLLWLPSFHHPASVRVVKTGGTATLRLIVLDGKGGYEPGQIAIDKTLKITPDQWKEFERLTARMKFWDGSTAKEDGGMEDGDRLIFEGTDKGKYHVTDYMTSSPEYLELCRFLIDLAGVPSVRMELDEDHGEGKTPMIRSDPTASGFR